MKKNTSWVCFYTLFLLLGLGFISCEKEEEIVPPSISLMLVEGDTQEGDTVEIGKPLNFTIKAGGESAAITNLVIKKVMPDSTVTVMMDVGLYTNIIDTSYTFYQNVEDEAAWTFFIQDRNRNRAETSLTVYKDPNSKFGGIIHYPSITMGYQDNDTYGQFLDLSTGNVYSEDSAFYFKEVIDVVTYYAFYEDEKGDEQYSPTFSSPGEIDEWKPMIDELYPSLLTWSDDSKSLIDTEWDINVDEFPIPETDFDACHDDSLIMVSCSEADLKWKFKWAWAGRVIPFKTADGAYGFVKVIRADYNPAGSIEFEVKMQNK